MLVIMLVETRDNCGLTGLVSKQSFVLYRLVYNVPHFNLDVIFVVLEAPIDSCTLHAGNRIHTAMMKKAGVITSTVAVG